MSNQKFKIWRADISQMTDAITILDIARQYESWIARESDVFLQFTGLHDKNGKEIYAGDILHAEFNEKFDMEGRSTGPQLSWRREEIVFHEGGFNTVVRSHFNSYFGEIPSRPSKMLFNVFKKFQTHYEIIGNIYENPELLA